MQNLDYLVRSEQYKDLAREAENERLVRELNGQGKMLKNAREVLGRSLVQAGRQLLNER